MVCMEARDKFAEGLYDICPKWLKDILDVYDDRFLYLDEKEVVSHIDKKYLKKLPIIRERFWYEYGVAVSMASSLNVRNIVGRIMSIQAFKKMMEDPYVLAYILTPPDNYELGMMGLLREFGLKSYKEILDTPVKELYINSDGEKVYKINTQLAKLKVEIIKQLEDRVFGKAVERRVEKRLDNSSLSMDNISRIDDLRKIEEELKKLEGK